MTPLANKCDPAPTLLDETKSDFFLLNFKLQMFSVNVTPLPTGFLSNILCCMLPV